MLLIILASPADWATWYISRLEQSLAQGEHTFSISLFSAGVGIKGIRTVLLSVQDFLRTHLQIRRLQILCGDEAMFLACCWQAVPILSRIPNQIRRRISPPQSNPLHPQSRLPLSGNDPRRQHPCPGGSARTGSPHTGPPPYGAVNKTVKFTTGRSMILWTVDTNDWRYRDAETIINYVKSLPSLDSEIVLMHSLYESTAEAVRVLVPWLIEQGYQLVTVIAHDLDAYAC